MRKKRRGRGGHFNAKRYFAPLRSPDFRPPPRRHGVRSSKDIPGGCNIRPWEPFVASHRGPRETYMKPTTRYPSLQTGAQRPKGDPHSAGNHEEHPCTYTRKPDTAEFVFRTRLPRCQDARNTLRTGAEQEHSRSPFPDVSCHYPRATKSRRPLPADPSGLPTYHMTYTFPMPESPQLSGVRDIYPCSVPVQGCCASPQ